MKILLITDDDKLIDSCRHFETESGLSLIVYRWFMKAMDNLEEIQPDIIIVNMDEYPRHWKIASVFANSGLFSKKIPVILYSETELNDEDESKAKALGICDIVSDFVDYNFYAYENDAAVSSPENTVEETADLASTVDSEEKADSAEVLNAETENTEVSEVSDSTDEEFNTILKNPQDEIDEINKLTKRALIPDTNNRLIIGSIKFNSLDDLKVKFIPDYSEDLNCFDNQMMIENGSYEFDNDCIAFSAKVLQKSDNDIILEFVA